MIEKAGDYFDWCIDTGLFNTLAGIFCLVIGVSEPGVLIIGIGLLNLLVGGMSAYLYQS